MIDETPLQRMEREQAEQPLLLDVPADVLAVAEAAGEYTGALLASARPEVYKQCVACLAAGVPVKVAAKALNVSTRTLAGVREREAGDIATLKSLIAKDMASVVHRGVELLAQNLEALSPDKLAVTIGILTDKLQALTGAPTSIVQHLQAETVDDLNNMLQAIEVEAEEVPGMGLVGDGRETKGISDGRANSEDAFNG
ncbi:MAG: hypothetical protein AAF555_05810 [Verrucomicrobiota bacterium]